MNTNNTSRYKDIVVGLGEIGKPILKLLSSKTITIGYDLNPNLYKKHDHVKFNLLTTRFLHICIPFGRNFIKNVIGLSDKFSPRGIIIHSTMNPGTTKKLQKNVKIPIIYSATRGIHRRMLSDLKRYTKFFSIETNAPNKNWAVSSYTSLMRECGVRVKKMSYPLTLELAKIVVDTSYYGWLITYAQLSNMIAIKNKIDYDEMWSFADEIHKFLGNRPKMFPGFIGGRCVIPNLDLISDKTLDLIKEINLDYSKILSKRRKKGKKY